MFMKRDWRYGVPFYKYVGDSNAEELAAIFNEGEKQQISKIFSSINFWRKRVEIVDNDTNHQVIQFERVDIGISPEELTRDFQTEFENCQWMTPFYFNSAEGNTAAVARLNKIVLQVLNENEYKYRTLRDSLGFAYDPIEDLWETYGGEDSVGRTYNDMVDLLEASGPISNLTYDNDGKLTSFRFDLTRKVESSGVEASTTAKGYVNGSSSSTTVINGNTITTTNNAPLTEGTQNKTQQYTTTQDDATTGRLAGYQTDEGTVAQSGDHITKEDFPVVGRVQSGKQNPNYTDKKTLGANKSGRHAPATDLIEAERELARFSLEKEFFNDLKKKMLVAGWD